MDLARRSVEVILAGQAPSGAYVAAPTFGPYAYCWFRDGAFIADAMSRVGEVESAEAFFGWCARTIERHYPHLRMSSRPLTPEYLRSLDCALIVTDHSAYDWPWIVEHSDLVVDTRDATRGVAAHRDRIVRA